MQSRQVSQVPVFRFKAGFTAVVVALGLWLVPHAAMASETASKAPSTTAVSPPSSPLPQPLGDFDVQQYQRLFHLQEMGRMKQATREMGRLENDLLKGHLLSQRYLHPTAWRSSYGELSGWLKRYNDHPDASRIFWLAKKRRPSNAKAPKAPKMK